jgi:hypothetical protein
MLSRGPIDPEPDDDERPPVSGKVVPIGSRPPPDWLTGPDEGIYGDDDPARGKDRRVDPSSLVKPVLQRPGQPAPEPEPEAAPRPSSVPVLRAQPAPDSGTAAEVPSRVAPAPKPGGEPGTGSEPESGARPRPTPRFAPEPPADFVRTYDFTSSTAPIRPPGGEPAQEAAPPADEFTAKPSPRPARPRESDPSAPPPAWGPVASSVPVPRLVLSAEPVPAEEEIPDQRADRPSGLPGAAEDLHAVPPKPAPLVSLQEPWWLIALDALRTNRTVQLGAVAVIAGLVLVGSWMWPHGTGTTPISRVRRYPAQYDGRNVAVRGRVGDDVFPVGGGWAFYLLQGRDTIVTFSRFRSPKPHEVVTVKGLVSIGFLDGAPRQAMFEDDSSSK